MLLEDTQMAYCLAQDSQEFGSEMQGLQDPESLDHIDSRWLGRATNPSSLYLQYRARLSR